ncbi:MAG: UMP kinase [bacterium]|nr:UMP kinase [bacterium]
MIKLSGEAIGKELVGIDVDAVFKISQEIAKVYSKGVQIAITTGGGNIFRGNADYAKKLDRVVADYIGMIATLMNAIALQDAFEKMKIPTRVMTALDIQKIAEPYIRRRAIRHMEKGRIVILAMGTGNPYFSTDTASALRAIELHCDVILKATKVDGVYTKDPFIFNDAKKFDRLTYKQAIDMGLEVMDTSAFLLCMENKIPVIVFNCFRDNAFVEVLEEPLIAGTLIE